MNSMFQGCGELECLDLSHFDTSNVTDMGWMFSECYKLKEIKGINNFNTINANKMNSMFNKCHSLEYLDLSNFNIINVTDMECMFNENFVLKEIKGIDEFYAINAENLKDMFNECNKLNYLEISKFYFKNVDNKNADEILTELNQGKNNIKKSKEEIDNTIAINFTSTNQHIKNYTMGCKSSDIFKHIEKKLFIQFPELMNEEIYYLANGSLVNTNETLENNRIKNGTQILISY